MFPATQDHTRFALGSRVNQEGQWEAGFVRGLLVPTEDVMGLIG